MVKKRKNCGNQRFTAGKLVMLSKKNTRSGSLRTFSLDKRSDTKGHWPCVPVNNVNNYRHAENRIGFLKHGEPVLLIEDPCIVHLSDKRYFIYNSMFYGKKTGTYWRIVFLQMEQIRVCYLTKKQYSQELVRAVIRRINKDYSLEKNKRV